MLSTHLVVIRTTALSLLVLVQDPLYLHERTYRPRSQRVLVIKNRIWQRSFQVCARVNKLDPIQPSWVEGGGTVSVDGTIIVFTGDCRQALVGDVLEHVCVIERHGSTLVSVLALDITCHWQTQRLFQLVRLVISQATSFDCLGGQSCNER